MFYLRILDSQDSCVAFGQVGHITRAAQNSSRIVWVDGSDLSLDGYEAATDLMEVWRRHLLSPVAQQPLVYTMKVHGPINF